ncbi:unnamed protein product [Paramecium octaurelia]|uniref:EF-hand domain-containing protein n=1 Tax=Paramecium octaurelia TaxID=43137 RepID=A0A8S1V3Y4_PAROT|nr:unnamed protein product [Paramecium octaurelia]
MQNNNRTLLAIMTVEITQDESDQIYIYERDDPRDLGIAFASKHDLPGRYLLKLIDSISQHKQQAQHTINNEQKLIHDQKSNYFRNSTNSTPYKQNSQISTQSCQKKSPLVSSRSHCRDFSQDISKMMRDKSAREIRQQKTGDENELTFTPQINKNSEQIVVRAMIQYIQKLKRQDNSVEQRLLNYGKEKQIKLQELRMQKQHSQDQQNKSFTYHPTTTQRSHEILKEKCVSKTYKDIYNKTPEYDNQDNKSSNNNSYVLNLPCADQSVVQQVWRASLMKLFNMLDKEQKGELNTEQVDLSQMSYEMLQIVAPVLIIMEERGGTFRFEMFAREVTNYCVKHNFVENLFSLLLQ